VLRADLGILAYSIIIIQTSITLRARPLRELPEGIHPARPANPGLRAALRIQETMAAATDDHRLRGPQILRPGENDSGVALPAITLHDRSAGG